MTETLAHWDSFESTQQELLNKYEHGRVWKVFKTLCVLVVRRKVASALEGLSQDLNTISTNDSLSAQSGRSLAPDVHIYVLDWR